MTPILWSDSFRVNADDYGVVLTFCASRPKNEGIPEIISKIGISKVHAKAIVEAIQKTLTENKEKSDG